MNTDVVVFAVGSVRGALHLDAVERVLPMVTITPLPGAPEIALGAINVHGDPIAVLDVHRRFGFPRANYGLSTRLLIARTTRRRVALLVDDVFGVENINEEAVSSREKLLPGLKHVEGVVAARDGLLMIHDLEAFLSLQEEAKLDAALGRSKVGKKGTR